MHRLLPDSGEAAGLLALMLLTDARRGTRSLDGVLVPLASRTAAAGTVSRSRRVSRWSPAPCPRDRIAPNPMVTLNRAIATAMVHGPAEGLALLATLDGDKRIADHYRLDAVRGHLLDLAGEHDRAREHYRRAARLTLSLPETEYLLRRVIR